jgi:hypothetical protein
MTNLINQRHILLMLEFTGEEGIDPQALGQFFQKAGIQVSYVPQAQFIDHRSESPNGVSAHTDDGWIWMRREMLHPEERQILCEAGFIDLVAYLKKKSGTPFTEP